MKHYALISKEFMKAARDWNELSLDEQKAYLSRHPKSKRRLTGDNTVDQPEQSKQDKGSYKITHTNVRDVDNRNSEYDVKANINGKDYTVATINMYNGREKDVITTKWNQKFLNEFFPKEKLTDFSYSSGTYAFPPSAEEMIESVLKKSGYKRES